tara:strand:+ start:270 stop:767 length:498 start_codon:yes stop_codon:yes gene_type:complete
MKTVLSKLNFIVGVLLVIPFFLIGKILENIARALFAVIQNIIYAFDFMGYMGGYFDMFWEKFLTEGIGTFVYCAASLCGPIFINKKIFPKFKINWIPSISLIFIFFTYHGLNLIFMFFKIFGKLDWIDTISFLVMSIGYFIGYLMAIILSLTYAEVKHPLIKKFL